MFTFTQTTAVGIQSFEALNLNFKTYFRTNRRNEIDQKLGAKGTRIPTKLSRLRQC